MDQTIRHAFPDLPAFTEAERRFGAFLIQRGLPPTVLWVDRESACLIPPTWHLKPKPRDRKLAQIQFDRGRERGFGVRLAVVCSLPGADTGGGRTVASVWFPGDERVAQIAQVARGLVFQAPHPITAGEVVTGHVLWLRLLKQSRPNQQLHHQVLGGA